MYDEEMELYRLREKEGKKMSYHADTEVYRLREILFQIYLAAGGDPDGLVKSPLQGTRDPDIPEAALSRVQELAEEYDELLDELPWPEEAVSDLDYSKWVRDG